MTTTAWTNALDDQAANSDGNWNANKPNSTTDADMALSVGGDMAILSANLSAKNWDFSAAGSNIDNAGFTYTIDIYGNLALNASADWSGWFPNLHGPGTRTITSNGGKLGNMTLVDAPSIVFTDNAEWQVYGDPLATSIDIQGFTLHLRGGSAPQLNNLTWDPGGKILVSGDLAGGTLPAVIDAGGDGMTGDCSFSCDSLTLTHASSSPDFIGFSTVGDCTIDGIDEALFYGGPSSPSFNIGGDFSVNNTDLTGFPLDIGEGLVKPKFNVTGTCVATGGGGTKTIANLDFSAGTELDAYDYINGGGNVGVNFLTSSVTVVNVTSAKTNAAYGAGTVIDITVEHSDTVDVTGSPRILMDVGQATYATYLSGSGTDTLTYRYTVAAGDNSSDLDYDGDDALQLNGGTIKHDGDDADLTLPTPGGAGSLGANKALVIDTAAPTVVNVTSAKANGTYGIDTVIDITAQFSEVVIVTGFPRLLMALSSKLYAQYLSGSGSNTLTLRLTISLPGESADLDYASANALELNGGTIKDALGHDAVLALPEPGAAGSLGANKAIVIETPVDPPILKEFGTSFTFGLKHGYEP